MGVGEFLMVNGKWLIDNGEWVASFTIINYPFTIHY